MGQARYNWILWSINQAGVQGHLQQVQLESARDFSIARLSTSRLAVGLRKMDNDLRIHLFDLTGTDELVERGTAMAGTIRQVALATVGAGSSADRIVAAVKSADDTLKLIVYTVSPAGQFNPQ